MSGLRRNRAGFVLLPILLTIAVILPVYYMSSLGSFTRMTETRGNTLRQLQIQEMFQEAGVLLHDASQKAQHTVCASPATLINVNERAPNGSAYSIPLCLPQNACIRNVVAPGNPLCINTSNASLPVYTIQFEARGQNRFYAAVESALDFLGSLRFEAGLPRARAQTPAYSYLPTIPATAAVGPPSSAPQRVCNGVDLRCLTVRFCVFNSSCPAGSTTGGIYHQRFGFPP